MNYDRLLTRVYDKQEKKMLYVGDYIKDRGTIYDSVLKGFAIGGMITTDSDNIPFGTRFIPMSCTARRDKNKKLIYESDIVTGYHSVPDANDTIFTRGVIEWLDDSWDFGINQRGKYGCELYEGHDLEVIGNIHENN